MMFLPVAFLLFLAFLLALPFLLLLGYFKVITVGFEKLGLSPETTIFLLFLILISSAVNIPLTKKKLVYKEKSRFFGLFTTKQAEVQGIAINLGGAVIPLLISLYFLINLLKQNFELEPFLIATISMVVLCRILARFIPGRGIVLPFFIPPLAAAILALILIPEFASPVAFISGIWGTLIGADILNLRKIKKYGGYMSIGGAGVFDGIFLVGIVSALLAGF